jgi:hypothetical protein
LALIYSFDAVSPKKPKTAMLALVAALAVASTASAGYAGSIMPSVAVPDALSCAECQLVVGAVAEISQNQTSLSQLQAALDAGCGVVFANNSIAIAACDLVVELVVKLLPTVDKDLAE